MDRLARPVALGASKIRCGAPVEGGHRQHLGRCEAVEVPSTGSREKVLQPVPVVTPQGDEVFSSHDKAKIT